MLPGAPIRTILPERRIWRRYGHYHSLLLYRIIEWLADILVKIEISKRKRLTRCDEHAIHRYIIVIITL